MGASIAPEQVYWNRKVPLRYEAEIAVIGGGMAGVTAAVSAARTGAKVILIERFAVVGGNATTGGVGAFCGETAGQGQVFDEMIADLEKYHAVAPYVPYPKADHRLFNHTILAVVLQEMLLRHKVKLLLHTQFVDVSVNDDGVIKECIVCGKTGPEALRAKIYIDCTGEAQVAHMAGFSTLKGRSEDQVQLPMSMMFFIRHAEDEHAREEVPEGRFEAIRDKADLPMTSIWPNGPRGNAIKVKIPMFDATDTESMTAAEIRARRRMMEVLDYYQKVEKRKWLLDYCSPQIGIREGRRVVGDYVLALEDLRAGRKFDDAIARGVYYLDAHKPDDDKRTYMLGHHDLKVPPYQIPLRCLIAKDARNMMIAGRCMSAEQLALSSARVMTTCAMMGQAAGIAASLSIEMDCDPREIDPLLVRRTVERNGAKLDV
ncbi:FAD-dependent oxidoreductase [Paenibacillus mesophilus]|uniref:FAD-dependent oxidoreductase n=1 Tax=Paenibacillus mesophilus TaxID=2582849 RepID=UPI00110E5F66|nr:FAD-dependent oxidoreductase [Paenibacillus mesophilus]TMV52902.1 FAD-dependent oxidoreductase [Paenibacillus mesophilus]